MRKTRKDRETGDVSFRRVGVREGGERRNPDGGMSAIETATNQSLFHHTEESLQHAGPYVLRRVTCSGSASRIFRVFRVLRDAALRHVLR
jgi:hypothetical protein